MHDALGHCRGCATGTQGIIISNLFCAANSGAISTPVCPCGIPGTEQVPGLLGGRHQMSFYGTAVARNQSRCQTVCLLVVKCSGHMLPDNGYRAAKR